MEYFLILLADLLSGVVFVLNKLYGKQGGGTLASGMKANAVIGLCSSLLFLCVTGFSPAFSLYSIFMAGAIALLGAVYTTIGYSILKDGKVAVYAMFLLSGGMLLPFLWGVIRDGEPLTPLRAGGVLLILSAIVIINFDKVKPTKRQLLLSIAVFFLNGILVTISNIHQKAPPTLSPVPTASFIMLANGMKSLLAFVVFLLLSLHVKGKGNRAPKGRSLPIGTEKYPEICEKNTRKIDNIHFQQMLLPLLLLISIAIIDGLAFFCQVEGASTIDAGVLYPLCSGGSIVITALCGWVFFGEAPTKSGLVGIALCILGLLLFL